MVAVPVFTKSPKRQRVDHQLGCAPLALDEGETIGDAQFRPRHWERKGVVALITGIMSTGIEQCSGILQDRFEGGTNERRERVVLQLLDMTHRQFPPNVHLGKPTGLARMEIGRASDGERVCRYV